MEYSVQSLSGPLRVVFRNVAVKALGALPSDPDVNCITFSTKRRGSREYKIDDRQLSRAWLKIPLKRAKRHNAPLGALKYIQTAHRDVPL